MATDRDDQTQPGPTGQSGQPTAPGVRALPQLPPPPSAQPTTQQPTTQQPTPTAQVPALVPVVVERTVRDLGPVSPASQDSLLVPAVPQTSAQVQAEALPRQATSWHPATIFVRRHPRARFALPAMFGGVALAVVLVTVLGLGPLARQTAPTVGVNSWQAQASVSILGYGGGAAPGTSAPGSAGLPVTHTTPAPPSVPSAPGGPSTRISPPPLAPWPPRVDQFHIYPPDPPYAAHAVPEPANDPYYWAYGQCTWWAAMQRSDENFRHLGDAWQWVFNAPARGLHVYGTPASDTTVVFQPGVEGAGGGGHVAHVLAVYPDGWFLISEMNFYWNGGGWGRVDFRFAYTAWGVSFIY